MNGHRLPRLINVLLVLLVLNAVGAGWTAVYLQQRASDARLEATIRADARTAEVRDDVAELLAEVRDPGSGSARSELFDRAIRIEDLLEQHIANEENPS